MSRNKTKIGWAKMAAIPCRVLRWSQLAWSFDMAEPRHAMPCIFSDGDPKRCLAHLWASVGSRLIREWPRQACPLLLRSVLGLGAWEQPPLSPSLLTHPPGSQALDEFWLKSGLSLLLPLCQFAEAEALSAKWLGYFVVLNNKRGELLREIKE